MSKALQIKVPQPCHENWHSMTPKEQGRFCGSCEKIVVDFSKMSDKEMLDYFTKAAGQSTCGRFANDQLNRRVEETITKPRRFSLAYVWNLLLGAVLFFESCNDATTGVVVCEKPPVQQAAKEDLMGKVIAADTASSPAEIKGTILNEASGLPVPEAQVSIIGSKQKAVTDSKGMFSLSGNNSDIVTEEVCAQNFYTKTVKLNSKSDWAHVKVMINEEAYLMGGISAEDVSGCQKGCKKEK